MSATLKLLRALPVDRGCARTRALAAAAGITPKDVANRVRVLVDRGLAETVETGCYRLTAKGAAMRDEPIPVGPRGPLTQAARRPRRATWRDKAWWLLRRERRATLGGLLALMEFTGERDGVRRYLTGLWRAGYLEVAGARAPGTAPTSNGFLRYVLVRDTGAAAPIVQRARARVWDANENKAYPLARAGNPNARSRAGAWSGS